MLRLRPPAPDEGPVLSALCLRAKAVHGYDAAFLEACRAELTVDPSAPGLAAAVAEIDGRRAGFVEIAVRGPEAEIEKLFVDPAFQGRGVGTALFAFARRQAMRRGAERLRADADPGAAGFYERQGAVPAGASPSGSIPGRVLPRYECVLQAAARP